MPHVHTNTFGRLPHNGTAAIPAPDEPVHVKGLSATYDRKFNLGQYESLNPAITIWVRTLAPEGDAFDLDDAKRRLRDMARDNVRAQWQRQQGKQEAIFLGLRPPEQGDDPILVRTVSVSLTLKVNLGDYNAVTPAYTDWADLRHVAHTPDELHLALARMWASLWANVEDEIARARGQGATGAYLGLPQIQVEDLTGRATRPPVNGRRSA